MTPEWMKLRDEFLQEEQEKKNIEEQDQYLVLQQQSEPLDIIDPDG